MKKLNSSILDITGDITLDELDIIINELKIGFLLVNQANQHYRNEILLEKSEWWVENFFVKILLQERNIKLLLKKVLLSIYEA